MGNSEIITKEIMNHTGSNNRYQLLRLWDLHIEPCLGCYSCKKPGRKCPRDDDMKFLFKAIAEADGVILSSPVYAWGANIAIQRVLDRVFLFSQWTERFAKKPCVTFVTYGVPYEEGYALSVVNALAAEWWNLHVKETTAFLGSSPGEVLKYEKNMQMAKLLGKALFDPTYKRKARKNECPNCFSAMVKFRSEMDLPSPRVRPIGQMECPFCGTIAKAKTTERGVELSYLNKGHYTQGDKQKRLAKFYRKSLKSFAKEKNNVRNMTEKYRLMDVRTISKNNSLQ
jgi:multimeric flavodoxin WrbA